MAFGENATVAGSMPLRRRAGEVAPRLPTERRILDGAVEALARHGRRKLSMSDISHCSGVSRATLYRYFRTKESVLEAIADHVTQNAREELAMAIAERPEPEDRLGVVLDMLVSYSWVHPEPARILEREPEFALAFVRALVPQWIPIIAEAIAPAARHVPCLAQRALTVEQLADVCLRLSLSAYLVPSASAAHVSEWTRIAITAATRFETPAMEGQS